MAKVHDRILEIAVTAAEGANTVLVTAVNYYRNRGELDATNPKALAYTAGAAAANHETEMGEIMPPPTHIRIASTFVA